MVNMKKMVKDKISGDKKTSRNTNIKINLIGVFKGIKGVVKFIRKKL